MVPYSGTREPVLQSSQIGLWSLGRERSRIPQYRKPRGPWSGKLEERVLLHCHITCALKVKFPTMTSVSILQNMTYFQTPAIGRLLLCAELTEPLPLPSSTVAFPAPFMSIAPSTLSTDTPFPKGPAGGFLFISAPTSGAQVPPPHYCSPRCLFPSPARSPDWSVLH